MRSGLVIAVAAILGLLTGCGPSVTSNDVTVSRIVQQSGWRAADNVAIFQVADSDLVFTCDKARIKACALIALGDRVDLTAKKEGDSWAVKTLTLNHITPS